MKSSFIKSLVNHLILALSILLVFLIVFDTYVRIPEYLLYAGRFHPVVLHFPIVLLVLVVINSFTRGRYYQHILLPITALVTLITAITGFLLSEENTVKGDLLLWHQWMGSIVALVTAIWYGLEEIKLDRRGISLVMRSAILVLIVTTGHLGGMITHGRDFLVWNPSISSAENNMPEDPLLFQHLVLPVLETKCISCHNPNKLKGGLNLSSYASLITGGESGISVVSGDPGQSELFRRIQLPLNHDDHMPPADENQLTENEIALLEGWIENGSGDDLKVSMISPEEEFHTTIQYFIRPGIESKYDHLAEVDEYLIKQLSTDYITIRRMAENSNALTVMMFPHSGFGKQRLNILEPIRRNIVELDLSFIPIEKEDMDFISGCESLENLEIDFTPVDDEKFNRLENLNNLRVLKAQGSGLTEKSLEKFADFKSLEKLFIWNTGISDDQLTQLKNSNPGLIINSGIDKNITFISILPAPEVKPRQLFFTDPMQIEFDHPLSDIDILYTLDGKDPQADGILFSGPIRIENSCTLKFMASKQGWQNSLIDSMMIMKTLKSPGRVWFRYPPDPKYPGRGESGLFDLKKGTSNVRDSAWLGFQQNVMELHCQWEREVSLRSVTLSSFINTGIHIFPPGRIEIRGGNEENHELLGYQNYPALGSDKYGFRYLSCPVESIPITYLVIKVTPLPEIPEWHDAKGKPGWFFVDEVVLEE
jgi:hypothetical protein